MIDIKGISKDYGKGRGVFDLNITLPKNGMIGILGKSGSGKTTLFNLLLEVIKPTSGKIEVMGEALSFYDINSRGYFSCIFQENNLFEYMTLKENLSLFSESENEIKDVLTSLGIEKYIDTIVSKLSGGERKRACIAATVLGSSPVVLADEPTAGLDDRNARNIMEILKSLAKEKLVLLITHDTAFQYEFCDRIITLDSGRVVSDLSNTDKDALGNVVKGAYEERGIEKSNDESVVEIKEATRDKDFSENRGQRNKGETRRRFSFRFMAKAVKYRLRSSLTRSIISLIAFVIIGVLFLLAVGFAAMENADNLIISAEKSGISKIIARNAKGNSLSPDICDELKDKYRVRYGYSSVGIFYTDYVFIDDGLSIGKISMTEHAYSIFRLNGKTDGKNAIIEGKSYEISSIISDGNCFGKEKYKNAIYVNGRDALDIMRLKDIKATMKTADSRIISIELKRDGSLLSKDTVITGDITEHIAKESVILETLAKGKPLQTGITLQFSYDRRFSYDVNIVGVDMESEGAIVYVSDERYESFLKGYYGYSAFIENDNVTEIKDLISEENLIIDVDGTYSFELYESMKESYVWLYLSVIAIVSIVYAGLIVGALRHSFVVNKRDFLLMKTLNADKKYIIGIGIFSASFEIVGGYILSALISSVIFTVLKAELFAKYLIALNFTVGLIAFTALILLTISLAMPIFYFWFSKKYDINDMRTCD